MAFLGMSSGLMLNHWLVYLLAQAHSPAVGEVP